MHLVRFDIPQKAARLGTFEWRRPRLGSFERGPFRLRSSRERLCDNRLLMARWRGHAPPPCSSVASTPAFDAKHPATRAYPITPLGQEVGHLVTLRIAPVRNGQNAPWNPARRLPTPCQVFLKKSASRAPPDPGERVPMPQEGFSSWFRSRPLPRRLACAPLEPNDHGGRRG